MCTYIRSQRRYDACLIGLCEGSLVLFSVLVVNVEEVRVTAAVLAVVVVVVVVVIQVVMVVCSRLCC